MVLHRASRCSVVRKGRRLLVPPAAGRRIRVALVGGQRPLAIVGRHVAARRPIRELQANRGTADGRQASALIVGCGLWSWRAEFADEMSCLSEARNVTATQYAVCAGGQMAGRRFEKNALRRKSSGFHCGAGLRQGRRGERKRRCEGVWKRKAKQEHAW